MSLKHWDLEKSLIYYMIQVTNYKEKQKKKGQIRL